MLLKVTRPSLCLRKALSRSRLLYQVSHRHKHRECTVSYRNDFYSQKRSYVLLGKSLNVCSNKRFYSDVKDDDMVKSWLKEIKEDFEKKKTDMSKTTANDSKTIESSQNYFKDIENVQGGEEKVEIVNSNNLSLSEQIALQKLEEIANKYAGVDSTEATTSSSDSDSDLVSSASESDLSDDERSSDKTLTIDHSEATKGYTKEEMIEMLKTTPVKEASESDLEELDNDLEKKNTLTDDVGERLDTAGVARDRTSESATNSVMEDTGTAASRVDDSGIAATRVGEDGLREDWGVVEIEDFVNIKPAPEVEPPWVPPIPLEHGKTGVFDVDEVVTLLRSANAFDIVVIRLPRSAQLGDHMVIASAKSIRQLSAIARDIQWIYKQRVKKGNVHLRVEGEKTSWQAMDTGNIFIHLFQPEVRVQYDLETLWTLGPEFDEKCKAEGTDPYVFSMDELPWLKELEAGNQSEKSKQETTGNQTEKSQQKMAKKWEPAQDVNRNR